MTGLDAFANWHVVPIASHSFTGNVAHGVTLTHRRMDGVYVRTEHPDSVAAERMAVCAALVAEGHDLLGLLQYAQGFVADHPYGDECRARIDAALAAADGE